MYALFHDQSGGEGHFALFCDDQVVTAFHREKKDARHPCALFEQLLTTHGLHLGDIAFLVCGVGPGSYTGIRSAAATMKAISYVTKQPIIASSSLLLFAPDETGGYLICADAGIGGVFVQEITTTASSLHVGSPERVEVEEVVKRASSGEKIVVQSREWLVRKGIEPALVYTEVSSHATVVAKAAFQEFKAGRHYTASSLPLLYLRKTQAEIDRLRTDQTQ